MELPCGRVTESVAAMCARGNRGAIGRRASDLLAAVLGADTVSPHAGQGDFHSGESGRHWSLPISADHLEDDEK